MLFLCPNRGKAEDSKQVYTHRAHRYPPYAVIHSYLHTNIHMYISTEHPHENRVHQQPPSLSGWTGWRSNDEKYISIYTMWIVHPAASFTWPAQSWDPVIKILRVIPLPEFRCKQDYMPKSIVSILFNSKCERERECVWKR